MMSNGTECVPVSRPACRGAITARAGNINVLDPSLVAQQTSLGESCVLESVSPSKRHKSSLLSNKICSFTGTTLLRRYVTQLCCDHPSLCVLTFDKRSLGSVRFLAGLTLLYEGFIGVDWYNTRAFLTDEGVWPREMALTTSNNYCLHLAFGTSATMAYLFRYMFIMAAFGILFDVHTRLCAFLCWMFLVSLSRRSVIIMHSFDKQLQHLLLWAWVSDLFSWRPLDVIAVLFSSSLQGRRRWWGMVLLVLIRFLTVFGLSLELVTMYTLTAIHKTDSLAWDETGDAALFLAQATYVARPLSRYLAEHESTREMLRIGARMTRPIERWVPVIMLMSPFHSIKTLMLSVLIAMHLIMGMTSRLNEITLINLCALHLYMPSAFWDCFPFLATPPQYCARFGMNFVDKVARPAHTFLFAIYGGTAEDMEQQKVGGEELPPTCEKEVLLPPSDVSAHLHDPPRRVVASRLPLSRPVDLLTRSLCISLQLTMISYIGWHFLNEAVYNKQWPLPNDEASIWIEPRVILNKAKSLFQLEVNWGVFSPRPPRRDIHISFPAVLVRHSQYNDRQDSGPQHQQNQLKQQKKEVIVDLFPYLRQHPVYEIPNFNRSVYNRLRRDTDVRSSGATVSTDNYTKSARKVWIAEQLNAARRDSETGEPIWNAYTFRDSRWFKYFEKITAGKKQAPRVHLGKYFCRDWNGYELAFRPDHWKDYRLETVSMVTFSARNLKVLPLGEHLPLGDPILMLNWTCA